MRTKSITGMFRNVRESLGRVQISGEMFKNARQCSEITDNIRRNATMFGNKRGCSRICENNRDLPSNSQKKVNNLARGDFGALSP